MSSKDDFNQGVSVGLRVNNEVLKQETAALDYLKSKMDLLGKGQDIMSTAVKALIEDSDVQAVERIYGIVNQSTPKDLKEHEQKILLSVLATLGKLSINANQQSFFNNLRHYLDLKGYIPDVNYDFENLDKLDSLKAIKEIAKCTRIFLFLEDNTINSIYIHDEDLYSHLELRRYGEIDAAIEILYFLFGVEGLTEIYGHEKETVILEKEVIVEKPVEEKLYIHPNVGRGFTLQMKTHEAIYNGRRGRLVKDGLAVWEITFEDYATGEQISLWKGNIFQTDKIAERKFAEYVSLYGLRE